MAHPRLKVLQKPSSLKSAYEGFGSLMLAI
jgi:hypothetical protein